MTQNSTLWKRNLLMLWLSQLLVMAGFAAMSPFVPLFMKDAMGIVDEKELAMDVSLFNLFGTMAYAIFCPIWGKLSDRFGTKPMLLRGTFVTAFFFPMMGYAPNAGWLIALRFLTAACAGTTAASQIMVARNTPDERQGFAQGVLSTAIWGGAMLGNVIGGLIIDGYGYRAAFWFCGILYFFAGFAILLTHDGFAPQFQQLLHRAHGSHRLVPWPLPEFTIAVWSLLVLFLTMGLVRSIEAPFVALKVEQITSAAKASYWTGIVSAVVCGGTIASGMLTGYLADILPAKKLLVPVMLISAAALWAQGFTDSLTVFTVSRTVLYMAGGALAPILQKALSTRTPKRKRGASFGFSSLSGSIGGMLAAMAGGWSMILFRLNGVFYVGAVLHILAIPLFIRLLDVALEPHGFSHRRH